MPRPLRLLLVLIVVPWLAASACTSGSGTDLGVAEVDRPLPELAGTTVQGEALAEADYAGRVVVVNFWATWCGPCEDEQPALQEVWGEYEDRGVSFVGVNYRDDAAAADAWIERFGVTYPSVEDAAGGWADDFSLAGAPTTYVADAAGRIRYVVTGAVSAEALSGLLDDLLASPASS